MELFKIEKPTMKVYLNGIDIEMLPPLKRQVDVFMMERNPRKTIYEMLNRNTAGKKIRISEIMALSTADLNVLIDGIITFIQKIQGTQDEPPKDKRLRIPYYPSDDDPIRYKRITCAEKLAADYCGISIFEVGEMDIVNYQLILREAVIYVNSKTESGREYLEDCYHFGNTEPDRDELRQIAKKSTKKPAMP